MYSKKADLGDGGGDLAFDKSEKSQSIDHLIDPIAEKRLLRKLDLHIVPMVILLYTFSFLDRVNIGNARLYKMESDLGLVGNQYQIAVSILFVTYVLFEIPSNLVLKKFTPSRYISFIATSWGIIATLQGVTQNFAGLVTCRLLLGLVESGLFPGMTIYLTLFYTKKEIALRIGYLFVSAALAGACGGLLAYGIGHMQGIAGLNGWRWILILEGIPTVLLGISTWWLLADDPESAYYLTNEEKALVVARRSREIGQTASAQKFHWQDVKAAFKDWKVVILCIAQFGVDDMLYGFSTFLPTIIKDLDKKRSTAEVQALTIPCYCLGAITYMTVSYISDKQQLRALYCVLFGIVSVIGYGILVSPSSSGVRYFGCFMVAAGLYVAVGIPLAWVPSNAPRYGKRTTAIGLQLTLGNCSGVLSPFLYPTNDGPRYIKGNSVSLALVAFSVVIYGFMWFWYSKLNRRRKEGREDHLIADLNDDQIAELGDKSPLFVYTL